MIRALSPAKVNLYLRVIRKREDGYHDLLSLMQRVSLADEMTFAPIPEGVTLTCPDSDLPTGGTNLAVRAAMALFRETSFSGGVAMTLYKRIPVAAGLGGGSSNAATTLTTLNALFRLGASQEDLLRIGRTLGADVPFFVFARTAWAEGIGDRLQAADLPPLSFVLVTPSFGVSTREIYEGLNFKLTNRPVQYSIPCFSGIAELAAGLRNDLEAVTLRRHPVLAAWKDRLRGLGAEGALMSGSGPTVFGMFRNEEEAASAAAALQTTGEARVFCARSLS